MFINGVYDIDIAFKRRKLNIDGEISLCLTKACLSRVTK